MKYIKIPKERVAVLIGKKGKIKHYIEQHSRTILEIDSDAGEVIIDDHQTDNPLASLKTLDIVRAIGRGFSPTHAFTLFKENAELFIFDLHDYVGKKENHVRRVKSRVIGRNGKTKRVIEDLTDSSISVYGHTIGIIANFESMDVAKKAIEMILTGSKQPTVYRYAEREMKKLRLGL